MAEILLVNPTYTEKSGNVWKEISSVLPPLGLAYIAAYLESRGLKPAIIDSEAERLLLEDIAGRVRAESPSWIGITATTPMIADALRIAAECRKAAPGAKIVIGGVHASVMPDEVLSSPAVDYVVRDEGEETFYELVSGRPAESIKGLSYKSGGRGVHNAAREFIADINTLPFPAFHLLPMDRYYPARGSYKRLPAVSLIVSRGCPGKCTFCYPERLGRKLRVMSADNIIRLIGELQEKYGIREVCFYDDTFTLSKPVVREFCTKLIDRRADIAWSCFSRVDFMDKEILELMKKSGCHQVCYGVESGDDKILENIGKRIPLSRVSEVVALTKAAGIETRTAFMFGNPGETPETLRRSLDYCMKLDPDYAIFNITTPYPGTEMFKWAKRNGYLLTEDWSKYDVSTPVMKLPTVSPEQISEFYRHAYRKFYTRPSYMLKRLFKITSFREFMEKLSTFFGLLRMSR